MTRVLSMGKPTVVEFGSNNCTGCREMKPVLHALAQDAASMTEPESRNDASQEAKGGAGEST
ncbi:MAG: hypothetical protein JHC40_18030 [Burkholderiales bacterium]|nr:hypothetical protein [Burkholderiales bacterium]